MEQAELLASDRSRDDQFGDSVAVDGDTIAIGADEDDDKGDKSGSVYIFSRKDTTWTEQAKLTASDGTSGDNFGESVAISGDTLVVGADQGPSDGPGSAYVFKLVNGVWTEQRKLRASNGASEDKFGDTVAISGDTVVVGADQDDQNGEDSGSAYVYNLDEL